MADNRTNEPNQNETKSGQAFCFTDEQVWAAAKAIADCHNPGMFEKYPENWRVEARAALVAAAGAAPQAESEHQHEGWMIRETGTGGYYCSSCGEPVADPHSPVLPSSTVDEALRFCTCSHWLEAHHERKCLEHHCACVNFQPVLQIDEDALTGVIWQEQSDRVRDGYVIHTRETARSTARAVAEWLKEQGR